MSIDADLSEHLVRSYNVYSHEWGRMTRAGADTLTRILREHGIDPVMTYRIDVLALDTGVIRVWQYKPNDEGKIHAEPGTNHAARLDPFMVPCRAPELFGEDAP